MMSNSRETKLGVVLKREFSTSIAPSGSMAPMINLFAHLTFVPNQLHTFLLIMYLFVFNTFKVSTISFLCKKLHF